MSYRSSYVPYKSNLPTSYKSGSTSAYSSRDDVTTNDLKNTSSPRFAPLGSPAAFRPSYSGGTYRSIPIKRDNNYTPYVSRFPSVSNVNTNKEKTAEAPKATTNKYLANSSSKDITPVCNHKISRYSSSSTGNLSRYGQKSRDPSPAIDRRPSPAPLSSTLRARSRDPSPALQDNKLSSSSAKLNSATNYSTYRIGSRPTSSGYGSNSRYASNSSSLPRTSATLAERALSYMTTSEMRTRVKQQREKSAERKVKEQEVTEKERALSETTNSTAEAISTIETLEEQNAITTYPLADLEPEVFIPVKVVTRATSPTPPGSTTFIRTRRLDIAKTIEKTIKRSSRKPTYADKEMQSDRLDDSTKYSRFGSTRLSSCTWSDSSKYSSGKYSGSSVTSTPSRTSSRSEIESIDKSKKDDNSSGTGKPSLNRLCVKKDSQSKSLTESSKSSKLSSPKLVTSSIVNKQKSAENSSSSSGARSSLPPTCPKTDSSAKSSVSSVPTNSNTKWTNKDFRKSALNVGPTDRPRKSRTPSDSEDNQTKSGSGAAFINGTFQYVQRLERSPSVGSETSNTSTATSSSLSNNTSDNQENIKIRCHQPKIKTSQQINKQSQIPNQIQSQSHEKNDVKVLDNKKILGNDINKKIESNSGCENFTNTDYNVTGKQEKLSSPSTPTTQTVSSTTALFKYLQINSPPIESSLTSQNQEEQTSQINSSMKNDGNKKILIRKLGSLSNFLIGRVEQDSDSEQIYFDNNSSSNSISDGLKQNVTIASNAKITIASKLSKKNSSKKNSSNDISPTNNDKNSITTNPLVELTKNLVTTELTVPEVAIGSDRNKSSSEKTDIEDFSSGLDTNKQINTDSAFETTDNEMKFKIRHIDSGEMAWWMKDNNTTYDNNDDDTTIAEDLRSLTQQDEQTSESVDLSSAWWTRQNENSGSSNKSSKKIQKQDSSEKPFWWTNENDVTKSMNPTDKNKSRSNGYSDTNNNNTQKSNCWQIDNHSGNININKDQLNSSNINSCLNEPPWYKTANNNNNYTTNYESSQNSDNKFNNKSEVNSNGISLHKIQRIQSGECPWWLDDTSANNVKNNKNKNNEKPLSNSDGSNGSYKPWYLAGPTKKLLNIQRIESGEKAWWLQDNSVTEKSDNESNSSSDDDDDADDEIHHVINGMQNHQNYNNSFNELTIPLGDRASPEGLEDDSNKSRKSPYDNIPSKSSSSDSDKHKQQQQEQQLTNAEINLQKLFISRHTNIDELLGGSCRPISPILDRIMGKNLFLEEITPSQVRIHDSTAQIPIIQRMDRDEWDYSARDPMLFDIKQNNLDDAALQVYKDGDFGAYLDLESSLAEQTEEIEGLNSSRKNSIVVRTQLSVRVHAIIEKLLSSEGTELRRALFSLKQIFQEDKDLVHGFVALGGLNCLVRVGNGADQNYQNCILRALGQVMLYVDGMNGVMKHGPTIQWLYSLIASKYRLVVKTALKLLLVFVEYIESNCYLLANAIHIVDISQGTTPWTNIMKLLKDYDNADTELLIYATSLINKTLSGLSDQDSFYDESDLLEQQGMEGVIQRYMSRPGTDLDLLDQLQLYEAVLKFEDGETDGIRLPDSSVRKTLRYRSTDSTERRKSRRHSTGTSPLNKTVSSPKRFTPNSNGVLDEDSSSSNEFQNNGTFRELQREGSTITPGLRRRRERNERQKTFMREQQEAATANGLRSPFAVTKDEFNGLESEIDEKKLLLHLKRDHTVKDLTQKLSSLPTSPQEEKPQNRMGDMTGLISKAKEGLAKSKSKGEISRSPSVDQDIKKSEPKKSENELHWEELVKNISRPLNLCDLDFTDLNSDDEKDVLAPRSLGGGIPPPPPPCGMPPPPCGMPPPPGMSGYPPPPKLANLMPPPPTNLVPPPMFNMRSNLNQNIGIMNCTNGSAGDSNTIKKNKKTVKLFWKEVREDMIPVTVGKTIWDELPQTQVDIQKLEHLFESRAKDLMIKKQQELNKTKEIIVLDHKRSNAINIAMTKLPPPRAIKAAILKMDATVVTREGIDKLLNMLPTDEERGKIQEAQMSNPELPLGSAEQFLLTLSSISELAARLKLWAFRLDFENSEREIAEPLMDLKQGLELLKQNRTFRCILSTLLSVGIFLNGAPVKGFQIEYLAKVPEVKDTVHKHSLLHHLCHMVMESSPDTTDLYSEIGPITRASKADYTDLAHNLVQLETECKSSWDRLKLIAKHDCPPQLKQKLVDFLADCAERIILLQIVHRRVTNRYRKFLLWLGVPQHRVPESRPNEFCRILSEFALEYRTTRERVQQQIEKKANHRERNKTRGKMIIDIPKFRTKEDRADAELKQLLGTPSPTSEQFDNTLTWRRRRAGDQIRSPIMKHNDEQFTDGDDEILESLVKTATKTSGTRPTPRERKRTRHADRKSLRRTLKNGLNEEEKQHVASLIKSY